MRLTARPHVRASRARLDRTVDPPASAGAESNGEGDCASDEGGYVANDAAASAADGGGSAQASARTYCSSYTAGGYYFQTAIIGADIFLHDDNTQSDAAVLYDWSSSSSSFGDSCTSDASAATDVKSVVVPLGCPVGPPPTVAPLPP